MAFRLKNVLRLLIEANTVNTSAVQETFPDKRKTRFSKRLNFFFGYLDSWDACMLFLLR
jgi:hypothetical protein